MLQLCSTVEHFTTCTKHKGCPSFSKDNFHALETIQPSLKVFLNLTQIYSAVGANTYRILGDLHNAIESLEDIHKGLSVSEARKPSVNWGNTCNSFMCNNWVCTAMALDPLVRQHGLEKFFEKYNMGHRLNNVIQWIQTRLCQHKKTASLTSGSQEQKPVAPPSTCVSSFASERQTPGASETLADSSDPWACYNAGYPRFKMLLQNGHVLAYWKRMLLELELKPLAMLAQDVLGLAASLVSVGRLFSQSGYVFGRKHGSLSAQTLIKQTSLRMWQSQGFYKAEDIWAVGLWKC